MDAVTKKLTGYVFTLSSALADDRNANDRSLLTSHLAAAARMHALLNGDQDISKIKKLVVTGNRSHGWSYIKGPSGEKISVARVAFAKATGFQNADT